VSKSAGGGQRADYAGGGRKAEGGEPAVIPKERAKQAPVGSTATDQ
jgi:hypothetical protein